jgi:hypothetical protein
VKSRAGIVLWIIITILLFISILALSLSRFKSSEVHQLSRSIDQSRLAAFAGSTIVETLNICKTGANRSGPIRDLFRGVFKATPTGSRSPALPHGSQTGLKLTSTDLPHTLAIIRESGYQTVKPTAEVRLVYTREVNAFGASAFRGFIEILASVQDGGKSLYRLLERREIRIVDMVDYFDKYALFVKYYPGWDVNRVDRRLTVVPINADFGQGKFSRIYLGKEAHPSCSGGFETSSPEHGIYLDISFNSGSCPGDPSGKGYGSHLLKHLFPAAAPQDIAPVAGPAGSKNFGTQAFHYKSVAWSSFAGQSQEIFHYLGVKNHYLVSIAKPAIDNDPNDPKFGEFSAAHKFAKDFENRNPKFSLAELLSNEEKVRQTNFTQCVGFQMLVNSYEKNWKYHYGYVGADDIWDMSQWEAGQPDLATWKPLVSGDPGKFYYSGIRAWVAWATADTGGAKDIGRLQIGRMQRFWGEKGDQPALMEGDVYLRWFKVGFFDEFSDTIDLMKTSVQLRANPTPLSFAKPGSPVGGEDFLFKDRNPIVDAGPVVQVAGGKYPLESALMSRAVDNIPFNRLLTKFAPNVKPAVTNAGQIDPKSADTVVKPTSKGGGSALDMYPIISPSAFTFIYENGAQFLAAHSSAQTGNIFLDGKILIRQGPLDLKAYKTYSGCGVIKVNEGDILVTSLEKLPSATVPSRLVLHPLYGQVRFATQNSAVLEASVVATSFAKGKANDGRGAGMVDFGGCKEVKLIGNLVVDVLNLDTLAVGGHLWLVHDPQIFFPTEDQRYRASISKARTLFALDSDKEQIAGGALE